MERLATRFPRAHEENTPKVRFVETKWPDWSIDLTKEEFKGLHWHRRDGEWYAGRDLWAVQVSIFNRSWHSQFKLSFFSGANCDFTRVHLRWWSTPAVRTFPFQLQTKCLPGEKTMNQPFSSEFRQDDVPQYSSRPSSSLAIQSASPRYHKNDPIKKKKKKEHNLCQFEIKAF